MRARPQQKYLFSLSLSLAVRSSHCDADICNLNGPSSATPLWEEEGTTTTTTVSGEKRDVQAKTNEIRRVVRIYDDKRHTAMLLSPGRVS